MNNYPGDLLKRTAVLKLDNGDLTKAELKPLTKKIEDEDGKEKIIE